MSVITDLIPATLPEYQKHYVIGGVNRLGRKYYVEIYRRLEKLVQLLYFDGVGDDGIIINHSYKNRDFLTGLPGSFCEVVFRAPDYHSLIKIAEGDDYEWMVKAYEENESENPILLFQGFILPQTYLQEHGYHEPIIRFTASDSLGLLKDITFLENEEGLSFMDVIGDFQIKDLISYILYKAGNRNNWRDCIPYTQYGFEESSSAEESKNYTYHFRKDVWEYYGWNCYDVLEDILSIIEAQLVMIDGIYHVRLPDKPDYVYYDEYSYQGVLIESETQSEVELDIYSDFKSGVGSLRTEGNIKNLILEKKFRMIENLLYNSDFKKGSDGWLKTGPSGDWGGFFITGNVVILLAIDAVYWLQNFGTSTFPSLAAKIDRGNWGVQWVKITFEARRNLNDGYLNNEFSEGHVYKVYVGGNNIYPSFGEWTASSNKDDWHEVSIITTINPINATNNYFHIYPMYFTISIRNIEMIPVRNHPHDPPASEEDDEVIEINPNNRVDRIYRMSYFSKGSPYHQYNTFPGLGAVMGELLDRNTETRLRHFNFVRDRLVPHFLIPRKRVNIPLIRQQLSPLLSPGVLLYDKYLETVFHIIQMSYNCRLARYDLQLFEYKKKVLEKSWILQEGDWEDQRFWEDSEEWIDGFYIVTFEVIDSVSGLPVEGAEVKVTTFSEVTDENGIAIITGVPEGEQHFAITKAGYNDYKDSETFDDYGMEIDIQLVPL